MKKYRVVIVTKYYKTIEFEAENEDDAEAKADAWANTNDTVDGAWVEVETYDLEEATE